MSMTDVRHWNIFRDCVDNALAPLSRIKASAQRSIVLLYTSILLYVLIAVTLPRLVGDATLDLFKYIALVVYPLIFV